MSSEKNARMQTDERIRSCIEDVATALLKELEFVEKLQYVRTDAEGANFFRVLVRRKGTNEPDAIPIGPYLQDFCEDEKKRPILEERLRTGFVQLLSS